VTGEPRAQALGALYAAETGGPAAPEAADLAPRAARLVAAVWAHRTELDAAIGDHAAGWRVERMPVVDRNVLRIGAYELLYSETPVPIVIDQAVELAKTYSTAKSGAFVNGVLDAMKGLRPGESSESRSESPD